jgi:Protein of unknown function (DUF2795)
MSSRAAEVQVVLEGVALPATKQELLEYARAESSDGTLVTLLGALPEREYRSLDEVGEALHPVQPSQPSSQSPEPKPESGEPPGREAYTDPSAEPGAVREL